ncbi:unnamed protein product [Lactuca virosa]|uniref:AT-hook motif nuclear-localized protein n=1 Tax=Lactuca virosa TaxID=75947 RepID=A0AAU9MWD7_9ASTR|nr:unnamed protein product [Lactuca virosa]
MEPGDHGRGFYYHHQQPPPPQHHPHPHPHQQPPSQPPAATGNGILPNTSTDTRSSQTLYPHNSIPSAVSSPLQTGVRRKRGRPRKYSTPEQAAAAKRFSSLSSPTSTSKKDTSQTVGGSSTTTSSSSKKPSLGNAGQGFTPYMITVTAGEDVSYKIMSFMQQSKQEICVISASGVISNATLHQPATSGGNITYEGRFDIISLCGSYVRADFESRSGGLSICLCSNDGQIIGGGVDGPLIAAGPVQVIVGAFVISSKNTAAAAAVTKEDASAFPLATDSSAMIGNLNNHQNSDKYPFIIQNATTPLPSPRLSDWRSNNDSRNTSGFNLSGRVNHGENPSPNEDIYQFRD